MLCLRSKLDLMKTQELALDGLRWDGEELVMGGRFNGDRYSIFQDRWDISCRYDVRRLFFTNP